ncbi:Uncharacterized protein PECH_007145 [Penicillium ucsense]|uniref:NAD-dependent epimerase/dehydratase domain-containing protein n=2 Tax=Penicillium TaxID=5073 RepID=A0A8J8W8L2_9EURO|nr:nucleoside-diphosphate-sugar epimerase [Penicillium diatomitis]XP_056786337.1 nucleoside-diphosphate-sugar epimerase [Penicillium diatomitis]KAF7718836.1 Uncharacterized protein PECM_000754 [Penicillium ucsense]KAF7735081.1 Uncharacterized protein PECH_007145 [Penicillium ucsense]KAJ5469224.1 nucleoside-diphosphate-sugar epimerase [Penicillium diatomitis]KAJ5471791.1 nucleoside-diphosphate-sugar epimerase [Penicillium diatomitis]
MPARIFITGAAGYVGGQTTGLLMSTHPEYEVVALVRNEEQALKVKGRWPEINTVIGTLDDHAILRQESTKAAVVLQLASSDHISCIEPLISGLATSGGKMVHISGTGVLNDASTGFGNPAPKIFDDVKDIEEITSLDQSALHRNVDDAVITGGKQHNVPTAIICPPLIYGIGEGPVKKRSIQIPFLTEAILKRGRAFTVGDGKNVWDHIHVSDVAKACVFLVEEALKPQGSAQWGPTGYYFVESGEFAWREVSEAIAQLVKEEGKLEAADVDPLSVDEALKFHPWAPVLWGGNCRSRASRLRSMGWKPEGPTLWEALPAMVKAEIAALKP